LLQAVRAAGPREDRRAGADRVLRAVQRQLAGPAQHVVHLVLVLRVQPDRRAGMQGALAKHERRVRRLGEKRIPRRLAAALVLAAAAPRADAQTITVFSAQVDTGSNTLALQGASFPAGTRLFVLSPPLAELAVTSATASEIRATLPASIAPGNYLLLLY